VTKDGLLDEERWRKRLRRSKRYQDTFSKNWKRNEQLIFGRTPGNPESTMTVAYAYGIVKSLESAVYVQDPEGFAQAYDEAKKEAARRWTNIIQYDLGLMDLKSVGNLGLMDNWIYGYMPCLEVLQNEKYEPPGDEKKKKKDADRDIVIVHQNYEARRINPWDQLFDPHGQRIDLSDHRYTIHAWYPTVEELQKDPIFKKNLPEEIENFPEVTPFTRRDKATSAPERYVHHDVEKDVQYRTICVWEAADKLNGERLYLTDHDEHLIGREDWGFRLNINGRRLFPTTLMAFNPSGVSFYPTPEIDLVANQLMMLNEMDAIIYKDAKTKWRKYYAFRNVLSESEAAKMTDPMPENSVLMLDPSRLEDLATNQMHQYPDGRQFVGAIPDPAPKQDLFVVREMLITEVHEIIGYGPPTRGGIPQTRSAKEAIAIKERMEQRLNTRLDAITCFYQAFIPKHMQIVQQTLETQRYAGAFPSDAKGYQTLMYSKEAIMGQFEYVVYAGSSMPKNTESFRASQREMFNLMAGIAQREGLPLQPIFENLAMAYQWRGVDEMFKNHKLFLKQLAIAWFAIQQGKQIPPATMLNLQGKVVMSGLNQAELAEIAQEVKGQLGPGGGTPPGGPQNTRGDPNAGNTESLGP